MNQRSLIAIIILAGIGSIGSVMAFSGTISAGQGNFNNVLVTGTCSGCGGEGSFTTWSNTLNSTIAGTGGFSTDYIFVGNDGSINTYDSNKKMAYVLTNGTIITVNDNISNQNLDLNKASEQSMTGEYRILMNGTDNTVVVYKNNIVKQKIGIKISDFFSSSFGSTDFGCNISPNGKYIACSGEDTGGSLDRIIEFVGA